MKKRVVDPGSNISDREARKVARKNAWEPKTKTRRDAHKALVLGGVADETNG